MPNRLTVTPKWAHLEEGSPEERAAFGAIEIRVDDKCFTEGVNRFTSAIERAPFVSGFHLAEWLVWNWWRLRWEPRPESPDTNWEMAHKMTSIGEGYDWPRITIWSDGRQTYLTSRSNPDNRNASYRYITNDDASIPSEEFEKGVKEFIESVCKRMGGQGIRESDLHILWSELRKEQDDTEIAHRRKLEALLGFDPEEADPNIIDLLIKEEAKLGKEAVEELAVAQIVKKQPEIAQKLEDLAQSQGFEISAADRFRFSQRTSLGPGGNAEAWEIGESMARAVRRDGTLGNKPIDDEELCELAAVNGEILERNSRGQTKLRQAMGFILANSNTRKIVLRPSNKNGRRFQLARLLGDQLASQTEERLLPSTQTHTYRQKLQRSFAAELLSPFEEVEQMLENNYSKENRERVAKHFQVSSWNIEYQLFNNGRISREEFETARIAD